MSNGIPFVWRFLIGALIIFLALVGVWAIGVVSWIVPAGFVLAVWVSSVLAVLFLLCGGL